MDFSVNAVVVGFFVIVVVVGLSLVVVGFSTRKIKHLLNDCYDLLAIAGHVL